jgi:hypothetical protein
MSLLVADCPRCGARKITFDVEQDHFLYEEFNWKRWYEVFCICRQCRRATIFVLHLDNIEYQGAISSGLTRPDGALNRFMAIAGFISLKDMATNPPPEHLPAKIEAAFKEGATCISVGCYNAAGTMFRLCVDLATRSKLPKKDVAGLNAAIRRNLGLRLGLQTA